MTDRRRKLNQRFNNLRRGFTMAELLATIAIIGILAAFGFVNVYRHQRNLHLTEMDDTAREIFTAAQDHLTIAKSSGKWEKFYKNHGEKKDAISNDPALGSQMADEPSDSLVDDWSNGEKHDFHYFAVGDSNTTKKLQDIILPNGSIDGTIVPTSTTDSHSIIIEYDARTAVVYGVWYTDGKNGWFGSARHHDISDTDRTAGRPVKADDGKVYDTTSKAYRRGDDDHSRAQLGYYGGGTNVKPDKYDYSALTTPEAEIVNADELYLRVKTLPKNNSAYANIKTSILVEGDISKASQKIDITNINWHETEDRVRQRTTGKFDCYLLDSVTDGKNGHFASKFPAFIPGENITITVTHTLGSRHKSIQMHTNSLFANTSETTSGKYTASLKYGRHLQNLSRTVSGLNDKDLEKFTATSAALEKNIDIDWAKFYRFDDLDGWEKRDAKNQHIFLLDGADTGSSALYSIVNGYLELIDGNNHKIKNLQLQREGTGSTVGLIGNNKLGQNLKIWNLTLQNPYLNSNMAAEVIGRNTGFFIGEASNRVDLFNCNVEMSELEDNPAIVDRSASAGEKNNFSSQDNISMFVGKAMEGSNLTIRKAAVTVDPSRDITMTSGQENTGLLIGQSENNTVEVSDINVRLQGTLSLTAAKGNAGGLIGDDSGQITVKNSQVSVENNFTISGNRNGDGNSNGNAGGLIGKAVNCKPDIESSSIKVSDASRDTKGITISATTNAGGIIGYLSTDVSDNNKIYNIQYDGGNYGVVKADSRSAAGFIGRIESKGLSITDSSTTTYVYMKGSSNANVGRAGGFIGYLQQDSGNTQINKCYYGGRTNQRTYSETAGYGTTPGYDGENFTIGGYNIVNEGSAAGSDVASAGGFLGTAQGDAGTIQISNSYTTGSVYINDGEAGGFVGKASTERNATNAPLILTNTYTTGLVGKKNQNSNIGTFIGQYRLNGNSRNNYYLNGVNSGSVFAIGEDIDTSDSYEKKKNIPDDNGTIIQVGSAASTGSPFQVAESDQQAASPYDSVLDSTYPYKFVTHLSGTASVLTEHTGDWPVVDKAQLSIGLLYYERLASDPTGVYYHGYMVSTDDQKSTTYKEATYKPVQTELPKAIDPNGDGLVDTKGTYVSEDGYVLIVKKENVDMLDNLSMSIWGVDNFNNGVRGKSNTFTWYTAPTAKLNSTGLLTQYDDFDLNKVGLSDDDYVAYSFNMDRLLGGWTYQSEQHGASLSLFEDYSANDHVNKASFSFMPVFAGAIKAPAKDGTLSEIGSNGGKGKYTYQIRSARQLNTLADLDGNVFKGSYLTTEGGGASIVQQSMDITFDPKKVNFTMCGPDGKMVEATDKVHITKDSSGNYLNHTIASVASDAVLESTESKVPGDNSSLYSLDDLRNPLVGSKFNESMNMGTIQDLVIMNSNLPYLVNGNVNATSTLKNISLKDSVMNQYGLTYTNDGQITDCHIDRSEVVGSGFAENSHGSIQNCDINDTLIHHSGIASKIEDWNRGPVNGNTLQNVVIEGNGFADMTTGKLSSNKIINARIGQNGFAGTIGGGEIKDCQIYSDKDTYTDALKEEGTLKYYTPDWDLNDLYDYVQIGKNSSGQTTKGNIGGFAGTVSGGSVTDCSVTGNVYASGNAAGFAYIASGGTISDSYANTIIRATGNAAGFMYDTNGQWPTLTKDHALGIMTAQNVAGFAFSASTGRISDSYTAVWRVNTPASGQYYAFASSGSQLQECYYLINGYKTSGKLNNVTGVTSMNLKVRSNLGEAATQSHTVAYGQYMGRLIDQTMYPYPVSSSITNYGDWYDSDDDNVLYDPLTVQFFDEDGSKLSDQLLVNRGDSIKNKIPGDKDNEKSAEPRSVTGRKFIGWYTMPDSGSRISDDEFSTVTKNIRAYAHYDIDDGYVELNYVNPKTNKVSEIGIEKISNGNVKEPETQDLPEFGGYTRSETWNASADGSGANYEVKDGEIQSVGSVKKLYLTYSKSRTYKITLEIRADNPKQTFPLIYQSYIYEYAKGKDYDLTQSLEDFEKSVADKNGKSDYELESLQERDTATQGISIKDSLKNVTDNEAASLDKTKKTVHLKGTADSDRTYVVLYKGKTVNYTIAHVFADSTGPSGGDFDDIRYAKGQTYTVTQPFEGSLGEYVDLESKVYRNDGYSVQLNPGSNFVLNAENQRYVINYTRNNYHFTVDTDGADVVEQSPFSVPYGASIGSRSTYLGNEPTTSKPGYHTTGWSYTYTEGNAEGRPNLNAGNATMPAADVTATAQWTENTTAPYMVEVWMQKVDSSQTANPQEVGNNYDYYGSFSVNGAAVDRVPDALRNDSSIGSLVSQYLPASGTGLRYFNLNPDTEGRNIDSKTNSMKTVQPDGSTVYRVYYDRKKITFNFKFNNSPDWQQLYVVRSGNSWSGYTYTVTTNSQGGTALTGNNADYQNGRITYYPYGRRWADDYSYTVDNDFDTAAISWSGNNLVYNAAYIANPPTVPSYSGLYGQVLSQKAQDLFEKYKWRYVNSDGGWTTLTMLANYILPGGEKDAGSDNTLTLQCAGENQGTCYIRHYQEQLDGTWKLTTTTKADSVNNFNLTNKYDGFTVYGFTWGDLSSRTSSANEVTVDEDDIDTTKNTENSYENYYYYGLTLTVLNIFHKRNRPTIQLRNVRSMNGVSLNTGYSVSDNTNITVPYQATLGDIGLPSNLDAKTYMPDGIDRNNDRSDYKFAGWYTSETFAEGTEFNPNATMPNHNIRLYAKWVCDPYQVTYYVGDKKLGEESIDRYGTISAKDDESIREKLQYSPEEGYTFAGWYTDPGMSDDTAYLSSRAVTSSLTLYAKYEKAANTDVTYTVQYLYENDNSRAFEDKVVRTKVGNSYEENPVDIPNAVVLDVRSKGRVTSDMDGSKIIFHYRPYKGSNWSYKVEDKVWYTDKKDKGKEHPVPANLGSHEQTSTYASQNENAAYYEHYRTIGDSSQTVAREDDKNKEPIVTFTYEPDYRELKPTNVHVLYGDTSDPGFEGMDNWVKPDGYHFEVTAKYYSQNGSEKNEISKPTDAGTYTVDLELHLKSDSGNDDLLLYELDDVDYRVLKKTVLLTSVDGTWNYDGQKHSAETVNVDLTLNWAGDDGLRYDFVDSFIRERGNTRNTFTTPRDKTEGYEKNYNIYRKFGTLTVR